MPVSQCFQVVAGFIGGSPKFKSGSGLFLVERGIGGRQSLRCPEAVGDVPEVTEGRREVTLVTPGMEGPLIYVPTRAASVGEEIRQWAKLVGDLKKATTSLRAVVNQRLLRNVCPNCRQPYQPKPELLAKMNLPAEKVQQLYRASGKVQVKNKIQTCPICGGTGYLGQAAAFEVLIVNDEVRRSLQSGYQKPCALLD